MRHQRAETRITKSEQKNKHDSKQAKIPTYASKEDRLINSCADYLNNEHRQCRGAFSRRWCPLEIRKC